MSKDPKKQFAEKISSSILFSVEAKKLIKEKMSRGAMTKEEMENIVEILSHEDEVKRKVAVLIKKRFNK